MPKANQQQPSFVLSERRPRLASSPSTLQQSIQLHNNMMSTGAATSSSSSASPSPMSALCGPPRKVSFEDGHSDDSSACSESSEDILPLHQAIGEETKEVRLSRACPKPRLLARHSPSLSLVDLARTVAMDDSSDVELPTKKRPHSAPVSPITGVILDPSRCLVQSACSNLLPPGMESSSEPWGHFVDMALPEKKLRTSPMPKTIPLSSRASSKSHTRRRQARRRYAYPYGEYHHTKLCFQPSNEPFPLAMIPSSESLFQLQKRKSEATEQIAGDLERLHFEGF